MLEVKSIHYAYQKSFALKNISFRLDSGEILGVIGESGCGKTTLLKLLFGKMDTDKGEMYWQGDKILGPSHQLIAGHEDFKYVTQDFELMPYITVLENIIKPLSRQYLEDNFNRAKDLLKLVNLENHQHKKVKNLSGGQKQRVALAQALAKPPKVLLLDEPFSHIDNFFKNELRRKLFKFINKENITCIIATHDNADVLPFADKIMVLKKGEILDFNSPEKIYNTPKHPYTAGLFGDYNLVHSNFISSKLKVSEIIVYPHEIELVVSKNNKAQILDTYFMGEDYKIVIEYEGKKMIIKSISMPDLSLNYDIRYKLEEILQRLHS